MIGELISTYGDRRVDDWPLMQSFLPTGIITCLFVLVVGFGPKLMQSRKPFDLHIFVMGHNILLILMNIYTLYLLVGGSAKTGYHFLCQPLTYSTDEGEMMVAKGIWWYYILRAVDLFDTVIHILRKKNAQLTFLHTFHHATMFPIWWIGARFVAGGNSILGPTINGLVHVIMYSYYLCAEMGPQYRKYLWWKRYLTTFQMAQFLLVMIHSAQTVLTGCKQPFIFLHYCQLAYLLILFLLFANFYTKQYTNKKTETSEKPKTN